MEHIRLTKSSPMGMMTATEVAKVGYRGFLKGKVIVIPGLMNKLGAQSVRITPRAAVRRIARKLQEG
jgi:short-subunit dehydrogenase